MDFLLFLANVLVCHFRSTCLYTNPHSINKALVLIMRHDYCTNLYFINKAMGWYISRGILRKAILQDSFYSGAPSFNKPSSTYPRLFYGPCKFVFSAKEQKVQEEFVTLAHRDLSTHSWAGLYESGRSFVNWHWKQRSEFCDSLLRVRLYLKLSSVAL